MQCIRTISLVIISIFTTIFSFSQVSSADAIEKIYIQTDKPMYVPGDDLWYSLSVFNGDNLPSLLSDDVTIQLSTPDGTPIYTHTYSLLDGQVNDQIVLGEDLVGGLYTFSAYTSWMQECDTELSYEKEVFVQRFIAPRILMKIDLDRESYGLGEEVMAKLEMKDLKDNLLNDVEIQYGLYVDGKEIERIFTTTNDQGVAILKAKIPPSLDAQSVSINARVSYKSQVESVRQTVPVISDKIDVQFLPEGGFLLADVENVVAFKALAPNGKPADVEGDIVDGTGKRVGGFVSAHDGMGYFEITPISDQNYFAILCKPYASEKRIALDRIAKHGSKIEVSKQLTNRIEVKVLGDIEDDMVLSLSDISETKWSSAKVKKINMLDTKDYARGVYKVSLTANDQILSERLVFLHPERSLNIDVELDKESYGLRKKVTAIIRTTDSDGQPVPSQVCVSAAEDKMLSHADDKQAHLVSELLLCSELQGDIHEPNHYFDSSNRERVSNLDLVMLTHGWRSYSAHISVEAAREYYYTKNNYIGQLIDRSSKEGVKGRIYAIANTAKSASMIETDEDGYFSVLRKTDQRLTLYVNAKSREFQIKDVELGQMKKVASTKYKSLSDVLIKQGMIGRVVIEEEAVSKETKKTKLQNVSISEGVSMNCAEIVAYRLPLIEMDNTTSGATVTAEAIRNLPTKSMNAIAARTAGLEVSQGGLSIRGSRSSGTVYYVDGVRVYGRIPQPIAQDAIDEEILRDVDLDDFTFRNRTSYVNDRIIYKDVMQKRKTLPTTKSFYVPEYRSEAPQKRTDFRQTIYWNPQVQTDKNGEAKISFSTTDEVTSFSIIVEGASLQGDLGRGIGKIVVTKPLNTDCKIPSYFVEGDTSVLRIVVANESAVDQMVALTIGNTGSLDFDVLGDDRHTVGAGGSHVFYAQAIASGKENGHIDIKIISDQDSDYISKDFEVLSPYFPMYYTASGVDSDTFSYDFIEPIPSSVTASYKIFSPISSALEGIESMLRSPSGCFEQVSSSTYPNVMVMQYLQKNNSADKATQDKAMEYIKEGYQKLANYETSVGGFHWWGKAPGHVALTAYGLLEFSDMMKIYDKVDRQMVDRTIDYLIDHKDGKGGFRMTSGYDGFGSTLYDVQTAYVLYALSEQSIRKVTLAAEYEAAKKSTLDSKDLYLAALMAMVAYNNGWLDDYRSFIGIIKNGLKSNELHTLKSTGTITRSGDNDNNTETLSVCALALMKDKDKHASEIPKLIDHISTKRKRGRFGATQATCLAIQAILKYAEWQGEKSEDGEIVANLNGAIVSNKSEDNGEDHSANGSVDLSEFVGASTAIFSTHYSAPSALNYSLDISYESKMPPTSVNHSLALTVELSRSICKVADVIGMKVSLSNIEDKSVANPTLVVGIPSGLSLDHKQLKELKDDGKVDYFEIFENRLVVYYNEMAAKEDRTVALDLKADVPGIYTAPPSCAYLYYDEENIIWQKGAKVLVHWDKKDLK